MRSLEAWSAAASRPSATAMRVPLAVWSRAGMRMLGWALVSLALKTVMGSEGWAPRQAARVRARRGSRRGDMAGAEVY